MSIWRIKYFGNDISLNSVSFGIQEENIEILIVSCRLSSGGVWFLMITHKDVQHPSITTDSSKTSWATVVVIPLVQSAQVIRIDPLNHPDNTPQRTSAQRLANMSVITLDNLALPTGSSASLASLDLSELSSDSSSSSQSEGGTSALEGLYSSRLSVDDHTVFLVMSTCILTCVSWQREIERGQIAAMHIKA